MDKVALWLKKREIPFLAEVSGAKLTTFGSGGSVRTLILPRDERDLREAMRFLLDRGEGPRVIGGGSNLLLPDQGYRGSLFKLSAFASIQGSGEVLTVGAGVKMPLLAKAAQRDALSGMEFAIGIPGTLGGAVKTNAGAFGQMLSDSLLEVTLLTAEGEVADLPARELKMSYHSCTLPQGAVVLGAKLRLHRSDRLSIARLMEQMTEKRRRTQPQERSAGSVFRKINDVPAALFIEQTGLKGLRVGGAELSRVHGNFIVNKGGATTQDFLAVAEKVKASLASCFGVRAEYEVEVCSRNES